MLPGLDGWKLIETARNEGIGTPIVVVSARGTEHDRVHALEIGADDYLVKPFSMKELVARVRAAARRGDPPRRDAARRADRDRGAADRPARGAGVRRRRERRADADRVPAPLPARARPRPRLDARRAAAEALGPARVAPRPHRRRLRPPPAREGRPARVPPHVHPDALRRRLQARSRCRRTAQRRSRSQPLAGSESDTAAFTTATHLRARYAPHHLGHDIRRRRPPAQRDERCARRRGAAPRVSASVLLTRATALRLLEPGDIALGEARRPRGLDGIERGTGELERLAAGGVDVLNPPAALVAAHDKLLTAACSGSPALPHPHTSHIAAALPAVGAGAAGRPQAALRQLGPRRRALRDARTSSTTRSPAARRSRWFREHGVLAQELVQPQGWDLRLVVAGGRVVGAARRVARPASGGRTSPSARHIEPVDAAAARPGARARGARRRSAPTSSASTSSRRGRRLRRPRGERRSRLPARCTRSARRRLRRRRRRAARDGVRQRRARRRRQSELVRLRLQAGLDLAPAADLVDDVDRLVLAVRARDPEPHRRPAPEAEPALLRDRPREDERASLHLVVAPRTWRTPPTKTSKPAARGPAGRRASARTPP